MKLKVLFFLILMSFAGSTFSQNADKEGIRGVIHLKYGYGYYRSDPISLFMPDWGVGVNFSGITELKLSTNVISDSFGWSIIDLTNDWYLFDFLILDHRLSYSGFEKGIPLSYSIGIGARFDVLGDNKMKLDFIAGTTLLGTKESEIPFKQWLNVNKIFLEIGLSIKIFISSSN